MKKKATLDGVVIGNTQLDAETMDTIHKIICIEVSKALMPISNAIMRTISDITRYALSDAITGTGIQGATNSENSEKENQTV